ncbi:MAG: hypothetical protein GY898_08460 [Proteobacteria bacterium]|nr:hypothetical protein [Pseudomonadota bacterium]
MSFAGLAWVDGRLAPLEHACVPITDRGFLLGDSCFDSVRTYGRRPFLLGDHLDRLRKSAAALYLEVPWSDAEITAVLDEVLADWPADREAVLRIMVTRGDGGHGLMLPDPQVPRLVVLAQPQPRWPERARVDGIGVGLPAGAFKKDAAVPAHVKSSNYLAGVLALREARAQGASEALLRAPDGTWAEATTSNLFVVRDGLIHTPGVEHVLPGVTRALAIAAAQDAGLTVTEGPLEDARLRAADEVFITSSVKEVVPVVRLGTDPVGGGRPGPVTQRVIGLFSDGVRRIQEAGTSRLAEVFSA